MKNFEKEQTEYYARTAIDYEKMHVKEDDEHALAIDYMIALMKVNNVKTILDIGSGTGRAVKALLGAGFDVTGIEPVEELLKLAAKNGIPDGTIIQGNGQALPFPDNSFDAICQFGVFHHVKYPKYIINEMIRCTKKAIFLSDTNRFGRARIFTRLVKLFLFKSGLWKMAYFLGTKGKNCDISDCDGIAYSYSVYDSFNQIDKWANRVIMIPTKIEGKKVSSWFHPLLTSSHVLLCAFKEKA